MAENVTAGSVPRATATSILPDGRSPSARTDPPEDCAIAFTRRDAACCVSDPTAEARIASR